MCQMKYHLKHKAQNVLALGSDLKNTFCLLRHNKAVLSQHIGDTANEQVRSQLSENLELFQQIYQFKPDIIAVDAHPGYFHLPSGNNLLNSNKSPSSKYCITMHTLSVSWPSSIVMNLYWSCSRRYWHGRKWTTLGR